MKIRTITCLPFALFILFFLLSVNLYLTHKSETELINRFRDFNCEIKFTEEGLLKKSAEISLKGNADKTISIVFYNYVFFTKGTIDLSEQLAGKKLPTHYEFLDNILTGLQIDFKKEKPVPYRFSKTEMITADIIEGAIKVSPSDKEKITADNYKDKLIAEITAPEARFSSEKFPEYNSDLYGVSYVALISTLTEDGGDNLPVAPVHSELKIDTLSFRTASGKFDLKEIEIFRGLREEKPTEEKNLFKFKVTNGLGSFTLYGYNDAVKANETLEDYMKRINARYILNLGGVAFTKNQHPFYQMMREKGLLIPSENNRNLISRINFKKGEPTFNGKSKEVFYEVLAHTVNASVG